MAIIKQVGLIKYYINLMTMDYGAGACPVPCNMGQAAVNAAKMLSSAYGVPYSQIEVTPMIGGNDVTSEIFTLADVTTVTTFAKSVGLGGVHWWSFDRDKDCPKGSASSNCNTYGQGGTLGFLKQFVISLPGWNNYNGGPPPPVASPSPAPQPKPR